MITHLFCNSPFFTEILLQDRIKGKCIFLEKIKINNEIKKIRENKSIKEI
jgi:hypothetical protein